MSKSTTADQEGRAPRGGLARVAPFLLIALFAAPALWQLLRDQMLCTHDGGLHYFRLVALRHAIEQGLWFSRWTPGLVYGYGFPFFNFREMLSYYLPEMLVLLGSSIPLALNLVYAGALLLSGWATYMLARDIWRDELGAIVAGVAYMLAPYQLLDITLRGNLPESMALALMPLIAYLFRRLVYAPGRRTFIGSTLSVTALLVTHNISSLLFIPLLALYLAGLMLQGRPWLAGSTREGWRRWSPALVALLLGVLLASASWLPAILEKDNVQLYLAHSTRGNDFHNHFLTLQELLAFPAPADPSLVNPPLKIQLGIPQLALGLLGLIGLFRFGDGNRRWHAAILAAATLGLLLLAFPITAPLWEALPLIRFVQFPWRLVGRAILPLALLAGAGVAAPPKRELVAAFAITLLSVSVLPWLYPRVCPMPDSPSIADVIDFERATGLTGVDPLGAYLPVWVAQRPSDSPMEEALRSGTTPRRFDTSTLPDAALLLRESYGANRATLVIDTPIAFTALYHTFFFPGWQLTIDDQPASITPTPETGLISFAVPAGQHTIALRWGLTPLRTWALALSAVGLLGMAAVGWRFKGGAAPREGPRQLPWSLCLLGLALLLFKLMLVDQGHTPLYQSQLEDSDLGLQHSVQASLEGGLELLGYNLRPAPAGGEIQVELAWTVRQAPEGDYGTHIALIADGVTWSTKGTYRPRGFQPPPSTLEWQVGKWAWDSHSIPILPGTPPGTYKMELTIFERSTLAPLNVLDPAGGIAGPSFQLGWITIRRPYEPLAQLPLQDPLNRPLGELMLLGAQLDRSEAAPGDPVLVTLFWRAESALPYLDAQLDLLAPDGSAVASWEIPLVRQDYPPDLWRVRDALMGQHLLRVPGAARDGVHDWQLTVRDSTGIPIAPPFMLGELSLAAPERIWSSPTFGQPADIQYTDPASVPLVELVGYTLEPPTAAEATIELVWHALQEMETSYHVFVHLLDDTGTITTQSDGIPAGWTRPTPGWAPGEYVLDRHLLELPADLPAGRYPLAVGLYEPGTGNRLDASTDHLLVLTVP